MPIRPIDVRRKEFKNSLRGYDTNQVDDFLDAVADEFERTYSDNSRMREEISSLRERLQQFEELEGAIRAALIHAEQAANDLRRSAAQEAEDLRRSAGREADFAIREAKARAHRMLAESSARVERIEESYEALQEAKRNFTNDFRSLLKTYTDVMESMEVASARDIEASLRQRLDTESIAIAHEAATYNEDAELAAVEAAEKAGAVFEREEQTAEDAGATQHIEHAETAGEVPQHTEPEPEVESSAGQEEAAVEEPGATEEPVPPEEPAAVEEHAPVEESAAVEEPAGQDIEREEPSLAEESGSQDFFDREEGATSSSEEENNRIFRASRFLRRRE